MIRFTLKCAQDHQFDSWFQSSAAFDKLRSAGMVACAVCGETSVEKALMAPRVSNSEGDAPAAPEPSTQPAETHGPLSAPASPAEQALRKLREHVEKNAEDVGTGFAKEARAIHEGTSPERAIYGQAKPDEAKKLIEDGVPVAPLPFLPNRKSN